MSDIEREHPDRRKHKTYKSDHWTVVDVEGVDKTFVSGSPGTEDESPEIRIDIDGVGAKSVFSDRAGENINTSHWMTVERAKALRDQLDEAISAAED